MRSIAKKATLTMAGVLTGAVLLTACSSSSDKPAFCGDVSTLQDSIGQLADVNLEAGVLDNVKTDLETVQTNAQTVVDSAKSDFPSETSALEDSVKTTEQAIQDLPASPSATEIAAVALDVSAVVNAAKSLEEATSSACS